MDPTTLRNAIGFVRRQWWVIAQAMVIVGAITAFMSTRQSEPEFEATSSVRIFVSGGGTSDVFKPTAQSILNEQIRVLTSADVVNAAAGASDLPSVVVAGSINASADPTTGIIYARVHHPDRATAVTVANNLTRAFVSERVSNQREDLQGKAVELDDRIASLNRSSADLEAKIVAAGSTVPIADVPAGSADPDASGSLPSTTTTIAQAPEVQQMIDDLVIDRGNLATALAERQINRKDLLSPPKLAEVESLATDAFQPAKKSPIKQGLLGVVIGMVVGVGLAVLRELLDDRIHTRHDLEKASGKPIIAELPFDSASASSRRNTTVALASIERPHEALAEAIRQLRTSVSFLAVDQPIGCVTITSAEPDEGKSLVAANLAVAFAQAGVRTILVCGDLRRPSLDARMLPANARGFSDLIMSRVDPGATNGALAAAVPARGAQPLTVTDVVYPTTLPALRFVPVGTLPPNPAELLASRAAAQAVRDLRDQCDMLIIDSPPTLVTDGVILADLADAAILVTALSQSHKTRIVAAINSLSGGHVRVLGVVLNKVSLSSTGYRAYVPLAATDTRRRGRRKHYEAPLVPGTNTASGAPVTPAMQPSMLPGATMQRPMAPGSQVAAGAPQPIVIHDTTPSVPVRTPQPLLPPPPPVPTGKLNGKNGVDGPHGANGTHLNGLNGSNGVRPPSDVPLGKAAGTEGRS
ncbi:MAG: hypothetical protein AB7Q27_22835 [Acidimicrobiia bacterium]